MCECFDESVECFNKVIVLDLKRTGGQNLSDNNRELLRRVLSAFAKRNQEIGYCQGFNFIAHFLLRMEFSEEQIFWMLVHILDEVMPAGYYIHMIPVIADLEVFKMMLRFHQPELSAEIEKRHIDLNFFFITCFVTLFTNLSNLKVRLSADRCFV